MGILDKIYTTETIYTEQQINELITIFTNLSTHPASHWLQELGNYKKEDYTAQLAEYRSSDIKGYVSTKTDFINKKDPNIGWKLHLNADPNDVKIISNFLITNGYKHKFLSGGLVEDGKIFTIYIGSYAKTKQYAQEISKHLIKNLKKPTEGSEIEFAKGVIGRFVGQQNNTPFSQKQAFNPTNPTFDPYGACGISLLDNGKKKEILFTIQNQQEKKKELAKLIKQSFVTLLKMYDDYFYDFNTPLQSNIIASKT